MNYQFKIVDKDTHETLCEQTTDIKVLQKHLPEAVFEYLHTEVAYGRLNALSLTQENKVCIIQRKKSGNMQRANLST